MSSDHEGQIRHVEGQKNQLIIPELEIFNQEEMKMLALEGSALRRMTNREFKEQGIEPTVAGSWVLMLGYINNLLRKDGAQYLSKGDLKGLSVADIGGGSSYSNASGYGPNLARVLAHLGAEVSVIDPLSDSSRSGSMKGLTYHSQKFEKFVDENNGQKFDMLVSNAFIGSPGAGETGDDISRIVEDLSKISPVQIHLIQSGEFVKEDVFNKVVENLKKVGIDLLHFPKFSKYRKDVSCEGENFIFVDSRNGEHVKK